MSNLNSLFERFREAIKTVKSLGPIGLIYYTSLNMINKHSSSIFGVFIKLIFVLILVAAIKPLQIFTRQFQCSKFHTMTLIYSLTRDQIYVLSEKRNVNELINFLKSKPFDFNSPDIFVIESRSILIKNYKNSRAIVVFDIPILLFIQYLEARQRRRIVLQLFVEIKRKNSFIQFKQEVFDKLVYQNCLLKGLRVNLVTTQSHLNKLPAIFKIKIGSQIKTSMLWYSVNSIPIRSRVSEKFNYPRSWIENLSNIDMNYVWTEPDPLDILSLTGAKFKVVGSIMFYKPSHITQAQLYDFKILILDVTPFSNLPKDSIYNYEYAIEFLRDVIVAGEYLRGKSLQVELVLKPKRSYSTKHHLLYRNYIESLEKSGIIKCLPFSSDIYKATSESKIVISPPYSSGALIAKEMNVKACYYVSSVSAKKFDLPAVMHGTPVLKGLNELIRFVTP